MESRKRKRTSKKNKSSWRKNTDVKDVQEFLAERSREQVTGVPAAEKSNEQLFFEERALSDGENVSAPTKVKKPLRSELSLHPNSAVPGFAPKPRKTKKPVVVKTLRDSSSDEEGYAKSDAYQTLRTQESKKLAKKMDENPPKSNIYRSYKDLWSQDDTVADIPDDHYQTVTRKKPVKRPASLSAKPSALATVQLPHPGMSYNPSFDDHQELLGMAVKVEEERELAAEKLEKKVQLAELTHSQREKVWMDEMTEGLLSDGGGSRASDSDEEVGVVLKRPVRAEDRKTKKQRRKERLRKEMERQKFLEKAKRIKMDKFFRLRSIKKEIANKEFSVLEKQKRRLDDEKMTPYQTQRLGKHKFEELDIECKLSSELSDSLRGMKPEGSLAMDRYKSLQRRNIIEPRELVRKRRKYKLLIKEKRSSKLPEELPKSIHNQNLN